MKPKVKPPAEPRTDRRSGARVKFCGMTRAEDIVAAESLHVDCIGFVFVQSSPRSVTLDQAKTLRGAVKNAKVVGVFADHSDDDIEEHAKVADLDFIQLHGKPDIDRIQNFSRPVIQAFRGVPNVKTAEMFLKQCPFILIDKADGQDEADFDVIAALPSSIREKLFLAGGLTPENVRTAADRIHPYAVDCARGIESKPGVKNLEKMNAFISVLTAGRPFGSAQDKRPTLVSI